MWAIKFLKLSFLCQVDKLIFSPSLRINLPGMTCHLMVLYLPAELWHCSQWTSIQMIKVFLTENTKIFGYLLPSVAPGRLVINSLWSPALITLAAGVEVEFNIDCSDTNNMSWNKNILNNFSSDKMLSNFEQTLWLQGYLKAVQYIC